MAEHGPAVPLWAKLSPTVADLAEMAGAALAHGAEAVTLINTALAMVIDLEQRAPVLGSGPAGGGLSGPSIHPIAVRAVFDVRAAHPDAAIIGVGGVMTRPRRRRAGDGRGRRRAGGHGHLPGSAGGLAGARRDR